MNQKVKQDQQPKKFVNTDAGILVVSTRQDWKIIFYERTKKLGFIRDEYKLVDGEGEIRYIGTHSMCVWKLEEGVC